MTSIMTTELLDFEEQWPRWSGRKDMAIRSRFGISPARNFSCSTGRSTIRRPSPRDR